MKLVIDAKHVYKNYGSKTALTDFSLQVHESSIFGLLGPNGAGKTTAIEIMLGLRNRDKGDISIFDKDPASDFDDISDSVGAMLQEGGINPGLKPAEAVSLYASLYSNPLDAREIIERVGLTGVTTMVRRLSGGQKQSLSLALALIGQPKLVFLDEPTAGMDPHARRRTWEIIKELKAKGTTVVITTHLMDEAEMLCDEIAIVSNGTVVTQGKTQEILDSHQDSLDIIFANDIDLFKMDGISETNCEKLSNSHYKLTLEPNPDFLMKLTEFAAKQNVLITQYSSLSKTLEEVFIELTEKEVSA